MVQTENIPVACQIPCFINTCVTRIVCYISEIKTLHSKFLMVFYRGLSKHMMLNMKIWGKLQKLAISPSRKYKWVKGEYNISVSFGIQVEIIINLVK